MDKKIEEFYQFYNNIFEIENNKQNNEEKEEFENKLNEIIKHFEQKDKEQEASEEEILNFLNLLIDFFKNKNKYLEKKEQELSISEIKNLKLKILKNFIKFNQENLFYNL